MVDQETTILVVDDSTVMRRIIMIYLKKMGYFQLVEARNGTEALDLLRQNEVGLILSDWCMRGMHGIDLLRAVRADRRLRDTPFVMVTAEAQPHLIAEATQAGVDQYLVKPFTGEDLKAKIEKALRPRGRGGFSDRKRR